MMSDTPFSSGLVFREQVRALTVQVAGRFALSDGASAHRLLESRQSSGKVLLIPDHQR